MNGVGFTVVGIAAPQGSKAPYGGEANPRTKPWRAAVSSAAADAMRGRPLLLGPVFLELEFDFPRPKSHFGSGRNAGTLKESAPEYHATRPDADKLARAIGDALTGVVLRDDSQITWLSVIKRYGEPAEARIQVWAA